MSIIPLTIGQPEPRTERSYRQDSTACGTPAQCKKAEKVDWWHSRIREGGIQKASFPISNPGMMSIASFLPSKKTIFVDIWVHWLSHRWLFPQVFFGLP